MDCPAPSAAISQPPEVNTAAHAGGKPIFACSGPVYICWMGPPACRALRFPPPPPENEYGPLIPYSSTCASRPVHGPSWGRPIMMGHHDGPSGPGTCSPCLAVRASSEPALIFSDCSSPRILVSTLRCRGIAGPVRSGAVYIWAHGLQLPAMKGAVLAMKGSGNTHTAAAVPWP